MVGVKFYLYGTNLRVLNRADILMKSLLHGVTHFYAEYEKKESRFVVAAKLPKSELRNFRGTLISEAQKEGAIITKITGPYKP